MYYSVIIPHPHTAYVGGILSSGQFFGVPRCLKRHAGWPGSTVHRCGFNRDMDASPPFASLKVLIGKIRDILNCIKTKIGLLSIKMFLSTNILPK